MAKNQPAKKTASTKKAAAKNPAVKLNKTATVAFLHDTAAFSLTFKDWSKAVQTAVKADNPVLGQTQKHIIRVIFSDKAGKIQTVKVGPLYLHSRILGRPMTKVSKHGQAVHPSVNSKQIMAKVAKHLTPAGWAVCEDTDNA